MSDEVKLLPCEDKCAICGKLKMQHTMNCGVGMCQIYPTFVSERAMLELARAAIEATRPTDEVVERVARAISPHVWRKFDQQNRPLSETDRAAKLAEKKANSNTLIGQSIRHARAAIAAIEATHLTGGDGS